MEDLVEQLLVLHVLSAVVCGLPASIVGIKGSNASLDNFTCSFAKSLAPFLIRDVKVVENFLKANPGLVLIEDVLVFREVLVDSLHQLLVVGKFTAREINNELELITSDHAITVFVESMDQVGIDEGHAIVLFFRILVKPQGNTGRG